MRVGCLAVKTHKVYGILHLLLCQNLDFNSFSVGTLYPELFLKYQAMKNASEHYSLGADLPVRPMLPSVTQFLMALWALGRYMQPASNCVQ